MTLLNVNEVSGLRTAVAVLLVALTCTVLNSYTYLPCRYVRPPGGGWPSKKDERCGGVPGHIAFYLGEAFGAMAGGMLAYCKGPEKTSKILSWLAITSGLFGTCLLERSSYALWNFIWFLLAFSSYSFYTCKYVMTIESVPPKWISFVGILVMGLQWSLSKFYSIFLVGYAKDWTLRMSWNLLILTILIALCELVPLKRLQDIKTTNGVSFQQMIGIYLGKKILYSLIFIWIVHGYIKSDVVSRDNVQIQLILCAVNGLYKVLVFFLWYSIRQKRIIVAAFLLILSASSCVLFFTTAEPDTDTFTEATTFMTTITSTLAEPAGESTVTYVFDHIRSFMIYGSVEIVWMLTPESMDSRVRYLGTGICSFSTRMAGLLGSLLVTEYHFTYPYAVAGVLSLIGCGVIFLVPEPRFPDLLAPRLG